MKGYLYGNSGLARPELNSNSVTLAHSSELMPYDTFTETMTQQIYPEKRVKPNRYTNQVVDILEEVDKKVEEIGHNYGLIERGFTNDEVKRFMGLGESGVFNPENLYGKLEDGYSVKKLRKELLKDIKKGKRHLPGFFVRDKYYRSPDSVYKSKKRDSEHQNVVLYDIKAEETEVHVYTETKEPFWKRHSRLTKVVVGGMALGFMLPLAGCIQKTEPDNPVNPPEPPADNDGLPDDWEVQHFGHLNYTGADDPDVDGLTNMQEYGAGTSPTQADTDADGYDDYKETRIPGLDPLDSDVDKDGLKDGKDEDGDGMSNWFEGKSDLYDPKVRNERYVILVDSGWLSTLPEYSLGNFNGQYDFFNKDMGIKAGNICRINHTEPAWSRFKEAVRNVSQKSDENDFLFAIFTGHGGPSGFIFNNNASSWPDEPRQVSYDVINTELNKINSKAQYIQVNSCSSESAISHFENTPTPRVIVADTNKSSCGGSFDLVQSIYPSVLSSQIKVFYKHPQNESLIKAKDVSIQPDKDKNNFVSIKEAFETARDVYFFGKHPDIPEDLRVVHRYPHISDAKNIANKFYFGDYPVED